jgi:hypothetical protein
MRNLNGFFLVKPLGKIANRKDGGDGRLILTDGAQGVGCLVGGGLYWLGIVSNGGLCF